jgi:hypothetical protein
MSLVETTTLLAGSGQAAGFTMLVDGFGDPVDARVAADRLVLRINEDDFIVLVCGVLVYPIGVYRFQR